MKYISLIVLFLTVFSVCQIKAVTLTDKQDRSLEAKILLLIGDSIKIELQNGRQFTIPLDTLNEESQKAVLKWQADKISKIAEPFRISMASYVEDKEKDSDPAMRTQVFNSGYNIKVTNRTPMVMEGLRVEYIMVMEAAKEAARTDRESQLHTVKDEVKLGLIKQGQDETFQTKSIQMKSSKLKSGWSYTNDGKDDAVDELKGVWLKFYMGEEMVFEYSRPSSLAGSIKWDKPPNPE